MPYLLRGALVEYGVNLVGPIPNLVIFQFNPETLTRALNIPPRPSGTGSREVSQAGEAPVERITLTAHFSAADQLAADNVLARMFGVGPRLAALEKMARPPAAGGGLLGKALDAIGDMLGMGGDDAVVQNVPRETYPRVLFIWGLTRVLPVTIESMTITEQEYDFLLNPVRAEVSLGLSVIAPDPCSDDEIAKGAREYSDLARDVQAVANLANTISQAAELIPF
jgi:hypothetical protein